MIVKPPIKGEVVKTEELGLERAAMAAHTGDDYSRAGCTVVIGLTEQGWNWTVYAPGYGPTGAAGLIESFGRPHGSTGIAIDAFIRQGSNLRPFIPDMEWAERAYAAATNPAMHLESAK
jgi:hypothetical protein